MYKKIVLIFIVMFSIFIFTSVTFASNIEEAISININGVRVKSDVSPIIKYNRTLVPARGVFEGIGANLYWSSEENMIIVEYKNTIIELFIGKKQAYINNELKILDVAPFIIDGRTMLPLRFISENLGMNVGWISDAKLATITEPDFYKKDLKGTVLGFAESDYQGDKKLLDSLTRYNKINSIASFAYTFNSNGVLKKTGESQDKIIEYANNNGIRPLLVIHNYGKDGFDMDLAHSLLSDSNKRSALINSILIEIGKKGYCGVNIDIEHMLWSDRLNYTNFIKELKSKLSQYGFYTTVSVLAKTFDSKDDNWSGAFNYAEIGKYADQVMLMTYDEHYFGGAAGPIASLPWVEKVVKYAVSQINPNKILLGIGAYGYDWSANGNKVVTFKQIKSYSSQYNATLVWNSEFSSPYFSYYKNGIAHEVWYEDARSISEKMKLIDKYNLGGIGIWRLGFDNSEFWSAINEIVQR